MTEDTVKEYIEKKTLLKELDSEVKALETIILSDEKLRQDGRIKIQEGRKSYSVTEKGYKVLEAFGYNTEITKTEKIEFKDFDITAKDLLLKDNTLCDIKTTKEIIKIL